MYAYMESSRKRQACRLGYKPHILLGHVEELVLKLGAPMQGGHTYVLSPSSTRPCLVLTLVIQFFGFVFDITYSIIAGMLSIEDFTLRYSSPNSSSKSFNCMSIRFDSCSP